MNRKTSLRCTSLLLLAIGIVIARSESAHAEDGLNLKIPAAFFVSSAALDIGTTHHILSTGGYERNPLLAVWKTPNRIATAQIASDAVIALAAYRLRQSHPKWAAVLLYSAGSIHLACGLGNSAVIQGRQKIQPVPTLTRVY